MSREHELGSWYHIQATPGNSGRIDRAAAAFREKRGVVKLIHGSGGLRCKILVHPNDDGDERDAFEAELYRLHPELSDTTRDPGIVLEFLGS